MARSVARAARAAGVPEADARRLDAAHALAMSTRVELLRDDHHPAYLHPGRTVLVLLRDVGLEGGRLSADHLCAAALLETEDQQLTSPPEEVERVGGSVAAGIVRSAPLAGDDALAEKLVALEAGASMVCLAERIDQLRHLHLREELRPLWGQRYEEVVRVWSPVAERTHPRLATRLRHWTKTFAKRL